jgi:nucleotide-binding universal stress UspA family protein
MTSPFKLSRVLVPHDFSDTAEHALTYALGIAGKFNARVTLVHVCDVASYGYPDAFVAAFDWTSEVERVASEALEGAVARARESGVEVDAVLQRGLAWNAITTLATEIGADLIVMGTHGRRGVSRALLGSVAEKVVRVAPCPVLTVHLPTSLQPRAGEAKREAPARP